jgi:hypothetical protein
MSMPALGELLGAGTARGVLLSASRDPDAKLTFLVTTPPPASERVGPLVVKIPLTATAEAAVEHESRMLVEMRRMPLGALATTIPRYVASLPVDGRKALVSSAVEGSPMTVQYHRWRHTASPRAVRADLAMAGAWLAAFQDASARRVVPLTWADEIGAAIAGRWDGHVAAGPALARVEAVGQHLTGLSSPLTAVHGDYWLGNLLVRDGSVAGVVDWEAAAVSGWPLRDLARFALSYALYLDRHTRHRVQGHPQLRRAGLAPGIRYAVATGTGWLPDAVRTFLQTGLQRLGLPTSIWYDVALLGIGDVAVSANEEAFAQTHLALLASLPPRPAVP